MKRWPTELSVANMQCVNLFILLFEAVYISLIGDILLPSIPLVLASNGRSHDSILKWGGQNIFRAAIGPFRGSDGMSSQNFKTKGLSVKFHQN